MFLIEIFEPPTRITDIGLLKCVAERRPYMLKQKPRQNRKFENYYFLNSNKNQKQIPNKLRDFYSYRLFFISNR